jgi:hypothetical protein
MESKIIDIGGNIALFPVYKTSLSKFKFVRVFGWVLNLTIWLPLVAIGMAIFIIGAFIDIYNGI